MNERYWLRVAAEISFSLYSGTGFPFLRAASLRDSHTQTGQSQANRLRMIGGVVSMGTTLGLETDFGTLMRVYESKPIRNALLRLANTKAGTPGYERALNQAAVLVRPVIAHQATNRE